MIIRNNSFTSFIFYSYTATVAGVPTPVGSCTYPDLCEVIKMLLPANFNPTNCSEAVVATGIDCTCPFTLKAGRLTVNEPLDIESADTLGVSFLASGDFEIKFVTSDSSGPYGSVTIFFTVKPKPGSGK